MPEHTPSTLLSKNVRIFLLCCDLRNFSHVARALGITQSAVSKAISALEREVGFELFVRARRPLQLTPEAKVLQPALRNLAGSSTRILTEIQNRNFIKPVMRVGILESLSLNLGASIIERLLPAVSHVLLITASANVLMQRLRERKLDLAITNDVSLDQTRIWRTLLFEEPSVILLPKAVAATHAVWTWERLKLCGLPLIHYWKETGAGRLNDLFARSNGFDFPEHIAVDTNALMLRLVQRGTGWAYTRPTSMLQNIHLIDDIAVLPMPNPLLTREVFLMGRQDEFLAEAEVLSDLARGCLRREIIPEILKFAPWLEGKLKVAG